MQSRQQQDRLARRGVAEYHHRRRGMSYVYFLGTVMLVSVVGLSAAMYARIQLRFARQSDHSVSARFYALSALELGLARINLDPDWKANLGSGVWFTDQQIAEGTCSLEVSILDDADGNPHNDSVLLVATGVHGEATHKIEVTLEALSDSGGLVIAAGSAQRHAG
jgi:hypothetical protein